jgi:hypothetical protein
MPVTNYFALKVGLATTLISSVAFGYNGLLFAESIEPFLKKISKEKNHLATKKTKELIGMLGAAFGFVIGAGVSLECFGIYKLIEATSPSVQSLASSN